MNTRVVINFQNSSQIEYQIRWKGFPGEDTWEPLAHLDGCATFIATFENHGYPVEQDKKCEKSFANSRTFHITKNFSSREDDEDESSQESKGRLEEAGWEAFDSKALLER